MVPGDNPGTREGPFDGKSIFADVIMLRILKWGDHPALLKWTPNLIPNVLRRGEETWLQA